MVASLLALVGVTFYLVGALTTHQISTSLLQNTVRAQMEMVGRQAVSFGERWNTLSTDEFYNQGIEAARRNGGRFFVVDPDGKIVMDSYNERIGERMREREIYSVLAHTADSDYGFYQQEESGTWNGLFVSAMLDSAGRQSGALAIMISVQETVDSLGALQKRMLWIFGIALLLVGIAMLLVMQYMMRPVKELSEGIRRMGEGDFTTKVRVKGKDEMAELAAAFNQMAEQVRQLDETRSQFVANASHELKTPLTTMKILVESILYEEKMDRELQEEFLTAIDKEIDRLSNEVSDLLTLAHIDSHKLKLDRTEMYFADTVRESADRLMPLANKREQKLDIDIRNECEMIADESKLGQVCYNIISNAIKYTPQKGEILVTLDRQGRDAVLTVKDNGIGIPAEDLPHIFDRFYRVDKSRTRNGEEGGTGLGLSIVRQIVRLHAGTVTVASELGKGTTFTVTLPLLSQGQ